MNPNFKPEMITPKLLKACGDQVQKYFYGLIDNSCLICKGVPKAKAKSYIWDCLQCPLGDGVSLNGPCVKEETYINYYERNGASKEKLLARGNRLIEILDDHGITIYDAKVKK